MREITDRPYIDPENRIERDVNSCKVRLFFCSSCNENNKRLLLDNLLLVFDRKMQGPSNVRAQ